MKVMVRVKKIKAVIEHETDERSAKKPEAKPATASPDAAVGHLVVNEDQLNAFFMSTPFVQKLEMVNGWLARQV
jgi:hypothetical protein